MIAGVLAEASWKAARDHFTRGGSPMILVYAAVGVVLLVAVLLVVHRVQLRTPRRRPIDNPRKLFSSLVARSGLPVMQREALRQMADDLELPHPAVILLGPKIFEEHARRWAMANTRSNADSATGVLPESMISLGQALFGPLFTPAGGVAEAESSNSGLRGQIYDEGPGQAVGRQVAGDRHDSLD